MRGDLIETYNIRTKLHNLETWRMVLIVRESRNRGSKPQDNGTGYVLPIRIEIRRNVFTQRVKYFWNFLPQKEVTAK